MAEACRLILDTSGSQYAIVLLQGEQILAAETWTREAGGDRTPLLVKVGGLVNAVGWDVDQLSGVAAARGPGSFTGIRVGLSVAAGIAYGRSIPMYAIDSLPVLAAQAPPGRSPAAALRDAGRGEVFAWRSETPAIRMRAMQVCGWLLDHESVVVDPPGSLGWWCESRASLEIPDQERLRFTDALAVQAMRAFMLEKAVRYDELQALYVQPAAAEERRS